MSVRLQALITTYCASLLRDVQIVERGLMFATRDEDAGRSHLVEVNIVVGPRFELQSVAEQDGLRQRIWSAVDRPIDAAWLTINFTADPRWA